MAGLWRELRNAKLVAVDLHLGIFYVLRKNFSRVVLRWDIVQGYVFAVNIVQNMMMRDADKSASSGYG